MDWTDKPENEHGEDQNNQLAKGAYIGFGKERYFVRGYQDHFLTAEI